jgi:hypothetical protein
MKHDYIATITYCVLVTILSTSPSLAYCKSAKAVCKLVNTCVVRAHFNPSDQDANNIKQGAANADKSAGGHQVWEGLSACANDTNDNSFSDYSGGCTDEDYWTIAHAEIVNLILFFVTGTRIEVVRGSLR